MAHCIGLQQFAENPGCDLMVAIMSRPFIGNVQIQRATHFEINNRPTPHTLYVSIRFLLPGRSLLALKSTPRKITPNTQSYFLV
jgi:hypothetical protein